MISKAVLLFLHGNGLCVGRASWIEDQWRAVMRLSVSTLTAGNKEEDDEEEGEDEGAGTQPSVWIWWQVPIPVFEFGDYRH